MTKTARAMKPKADRMNALRLRIQRIADMRNTAHVAASKLWDRMTDAEKRECQAMGGPDADLMYLDRWFGDIEC